MKVSIRSTATETTPAKVGELIDISWHPMQQPALQGDQIVMKEQLVPVCIIAMKDVFLFGPLQDMEPYWGKAGPDKARDELPIIDTTGTVINKDANSDIPDVVIEKDERIEIDDTIS